MKNINNPIAFGSVCIVDDDEIFRFLIRKVIEGTNLVSKISMFSNGLEAMNFIRSAQDNSESIPDIILLDLNMPVMDGWEFLDEYSILAPQFCKKVDLYIVSSSIIPADVQRAKTIPVVSDYIIKPVTKEKFIEIIKNMN